MIRKSAEKVADRIERHAEWLKRTSHALPPTLRRPESRWAKRFLELSMLVRSGELSGRKAILLRELVNDQVQVVKLALRIEKSRVRAAK